MLSCSFLSACLAPSSETQGQLVGATGFSPAKVYNKNGRAPGHLLSLNEFQKRLKSRLLIGQKIFLANQSPSTQLAAPRSPRLFLLTSISFWLSGPLNSHVSRVKPPVLLKKTRRRERGYTRGRPLMALRWFTPSACHRSLSTDGHLIRRMKCNIPGGRFTVCCMFQCKLCRIQNHKWDGRNILNVLREPWNSKLFQLREFKIPTALQTVAEVNIILPRKGSCCSSQILLPFSLTGCRCSLQISMTPVLSPWI